MALIGNQVNVTGTAAALTATAVQVETLLVKPHADNGDPIFVGPQGVTLSTGYPVYAGEEFVIGPAHGSLLRTEKPKDVYVVGTSGDVASWIGTQK